MNQCNRRDFIKVTGLAAAALTVPRGATRSVAAEGTATAGKPNILLIMSDDQTWRDNGCYGNPDVKTPNIDRLARAGMRFTRCFTATAMCAPTRQQLYTGIFPVRNGAYPNHSRVYDGTKSIVHHLKALGYRVGLAGKRHFGPAASFPFENVKNTGEFITLDKSQPYCLIVTSHSPHLPWSAGKASAYNADKLTLPPYIADTPDMRQALCRYYAEITDFDREVGQATKLVDASGQADDTIFIYTSEQGAQVPHGKWTCYDVGLRTALVVRWPRRVKAGSVAHAMVQYVDVVPTLVAAAGGKVPEGLDGRSFLQVLLGKTDKHNDYVYGAHTTRGIISGSECYPVRSVRSETFKYIRNLNYKTTFRNTLIVSDKANYWRSWVAAAKTDKKIAKLVTLYQNRPAEELYDIVKDPYELTNLAGEAAHAKTKAALSRKLDEWMARQGDKGNATEMKARQRQGRGKSAPKRKGGQKTKRAKAKETTQ